MTDRKQQQHLDPRPGDPAPAAPTGQGAPVAPTPPLPGAPGAGSEPDGAQLPRVYLDLFALYRFPIGRRLFALSRVAEAAKRHGVTALDTWLEHALEVDRQAHEIELEWKRTGGRPIHGPKATELNHQLDRALGALDDFLAGQVTVFGAETERGKTAADVRKALFPHGVFAVTSVSYVEEHEIASTLVRRLQDPERLGRAARVLELEDVVARLDELNTRYGAELRSPDEQLSFEQIRALRDRGQVNLLRVVTLILALFPNGGKAEAEVRGELLRPILVQNEALRSRRLRRRGAGDVDPTTGEEEAPLPEPEPGPEPAEAEPEAAEPEAETEAPIEPAPGAAPIEPPEAEAA